MSRVRAIERFSEKTRLLDASDDTSSARVDELKRVAVFTSAAGVSGATFANSGCGRSGNEVPKDARDEGW